MRFCSFSTKMDYIISSTRKCVYEIQLHGKSVSLSTILPYSDILSRREQEPLFKHQTNNCQRTLNSWCYFSFSFLFPFSTWFRCAFVQLWYKFHSMEKLIGNVCLISCVLLIFTEHLRYDESKTNFDGTHSSSEKLAGNENEICRAAWQLAWENNTFYSIEWHF